MHVLLVEDAPELSLLFRLILEREKLQVTAISRDFENLTSRENFWEDIDVAVVDQFLDGYNGRDLLAWIAEHHPRIRRIMLTGDYLVNAETANAEMVLLKPVERDVLVMAVRK